MEQMVKCEGKAFYLLATNSPGARASAQCKGSDLYQAKSWKGEGSGHIGQIFMNQNACMSRPRH